MTNKEFLQLVQSKFVILDGATGSNLQVAGMPSGVCPEQWILDHPRALIELQKEYLEAGSDIILAPTFTASRIKLREYGLEDKVEEYNKRLLSLTKQAVKEADTGDRAVYIAADLTMTGEQLYPMGSLTFEELVDVYKEQVVYLLLEGVDLFIIETMMSLQECRAAALAIKEVCDLPFMVSLTFNEDGRTLYGTTPEVAMVVLQELGAAAVGVNCSTGPEKLIGVVEKMCSVAHIPVLAKPNAGLPILLEGKTVFTMGPEEFTEKMSLLIEAGATILGGCCGTTPRHIKLLTESLKHRQLGNIPDNKFPVLTTERSMHCIDLSGGFSVIGERINPTGKKSLQEELRAGELLQVTQMAEEQIEQGAQILDINLGTNGIDEKEMMVKAVYEISGLVDVPLCIDSSHVEVIEAALRIYSGRALINSISLEPEKITRLLPIAKKYGAMFILLPLSEKGLPKDFEEKRAIIDTIVEKAMEIGLTKEDIIVDALVNTIGANKRAALDAIETIRYCKEELKVATVCGLSNISFGLPERQFINGAFLSVAIANGLSMAIANPGQELLMNLAFASDLLLNKEGADLRYINQVTSHPVEISKKTEEIKTKSKDSRLQNESNTSILFEDVLKGNRKQIVEHVKQMLLQGAQANMLLDEQLIPAINQVGVYFDQQKYFLPQLISSAEAMKSAIDYLEPMIKEGNAGKHMGTIVMATVSGDIHDIGKNLVALMLKNYGYEVIDLGKDVSSETIIQVATDKMADIIGLSALMTTTMMEMRTVVHLRNQAGLPAKIIIGGAVITESFAMEIGADGYAADAQEAVRVVQNLLK